VQEDFNKLQCEVWIANIKYNSASCSVDSSTRIILIKDFLLIDYGFVNGQQITVKIITEVLNNPISE